MQPDILPRSKLARWIVEPKVEVSPTIATHLVSGLYSSLPIFLGGVINSIVVAALAAARHPTGPFLSWLAVEILLGVSRLVVVLAGHRAQRAGRVPPITIAVVLACAWAASVGFGAYICIASEDWVLATIACLSAAAMVSGICLRNFGTPRLVAIMMMLSLVPCALAGLLSGAGALHVIAIQLPVYMLTIGSAAFRLNRMMVGRMAAKDALERSEALNRSILESSPDYTLLLDSAGTILFCNRPQDRVHGSQVLAGTEWLSLLPASSHKDGLRALAEAAAGGAGRLTVCHADAGSRRWFDLAVSPVSDASGRRLVVARDITHQKSSEERALWMASHDPLTGLPNRAVLQNRLDELAGTTGPATFALLVLDIDNFKLINDTLGHDAGDALLCAFARALKSALRPDDLVARLGGDEFAILLQVRSDSEVELAAGRIFAALRQPVPHADSLIECNASIGACLYPRDAAERSELMKAADIALYSAKSAGRGQLKIFRAAMRTAVHSRNSMLFLARRTLASDDLLTYYQPKVSLRTGEITGFEALLRWRDASGQLRLPDALRAAFDDPLLSAAISDLMIDRALADVREWLDRDLPFGHIAINVAAPQFRAGRFADELLGKLRASGIASEHLQVEVTETVFLGRGADHVQRALQQLSSAGVRVALDDFGTGYASLAHLMHFPVDALKIDRSFIREIGRNGDADAITKAIVNLGHSLAIETIAEGVENQEQEAYLKRLGCDTGQGYLYSKAVPSETVARMLVRNIARIA